MMDDGIESLLTGQQFKKFQENFYGPVAEEYGLSILDIRVLLYLMEHQNCNTAKDIVHAHHWTKSHVSKSIEELIKLGYLERQTDTRDRRRVHLLLQEDAAPLLEKVQSLHLQMYQTLFRGVTEEELQVVRQVAAKIFGNIAEAKYGGQAANSSLEQEALNKRQIYG